MFNSPAILEASTDIGKASRITTLLSVTALTVGCATTTPSNYTPTRNPTPGLNYSEPILVAPRGPDLTDALNVLKDLPTIVSKVHTHNGPLKDRICTITYSNKEKVSQLCSPKHPKQVSALYSKLIPGKQVYIPSTSQYVPGYSQYMPPEWKNVYNPKTRKYEYLMSQGEHKWITGKYITKPSKYEQLPAKKASCYMAQNFSQKDGTPTVKSEICDN